MPNITDIADNLLVEETEEGLNLLIVDQEGRGMFPEGSKYPYEATRQAIAAIAPILARLPNQITHLRPHRRGQHLRRSALRRRGSSRATAPMWCAPSSASSGCPTTASSR